MEQTGTTGTSGIGSRALIRRAAGAAIALMAAAGPALAQAEQLLPPENKDGIDGRAWISGAVTLLLLGLVLVAAFLKTKRGHQD